MVSPRSQPLALALASLLSPALASPPSPHPCLTLAIQANVPEAGDAAQTSMMSKFSEFKPIVSTTTPLSYARSLKRALAHPLVYPRTLSHPPSNLGASSQHDAVASRRHRLPGRTQARFQGRGPRLRGARAAGARHIRLDVGRWPRAGAARWRAQEDGRHGGPRGAGAVGEGLRLGDPGACAARGHMG